VSLAGDLVSASPYSLVWMSRGLGVVDVVVGVGSLFKVWMGDRYSEMGYGL